MMGVTQPVPMMSRRPHLVRGAVGHGLFLPQSADQRAGEAGRRLFQRWRRLLIVPVDGLSGIVSDRVEHDVLAVHVEEVEPEVPGGFQDAQVMGTAKLPILGLGQQIVGGVLQRQENTSNASFADGLNEAQGALGDGLQSGLEGVGMLAQIRQQPVAGQVPGLGQGVEDGLDEGHFLFDFLPDDGQRLAYLVQQALGWVQYGQACPVLRALDDRPPIIPGSVEMAHPPRLSGPVSQAIVAGGGDLDEVEVEGALKGEGGPGQVWPPLIVHRPVAP